MVHQEAQTVLKILESAVTQQCHSDILWTTQNTALHTHLKCYTKSDRPTKTTIYCSPQFDA